MEKSTAYATLLTPKLGYDAVSTAVKEAVKTGKTVREVIIEKNLLTNEEFERTNAIVYLYTHATNMNLHRNKSKNTDKK